MNCCLFFDSPTQFSILQLSALPCSHPQLPTFLSFLCCYFSTEQRLLSDMFQSVVLIVGAFLICSWSTICRHGSFNSAFWNVISTESTVSWRLSISCVGAVFNAAITQPASHVDTKQNKTIQESVETKTMKGWPWGLDLETVSGRKRARRVWLQLPPCNPCSQVKLFHIYYLLKFSASYNTNMTPNRAEKGKGSSGDVWEYFKCNFRPLWWAYFAGWLLVWSPGSDGIFTYLK